MSIAIGANVKVNTIRFGDIISLKFPKRQGYLSAEGILREDAYISTFTTGFEEHLFQIYVQRQYSATNELRDFLNDNPQIENGNSFLDPGTVSHYEALLRGKENESNLNRSVMQSKTGNTLFFGDTIQLYHIKSKKYITAIDDLARDERENMKVTLNHDGSVFSWLKVVPRFKINRDGEPVVNGTEVLLKFSERNNEFLHSADRPPPRGKFREVNSSLESPTGWRLGIYHKTADLSQTALLLAGQLVYLRDPESLSMLAPLPLPISLESPIVQMHGVETILSPMNESNWPNPWNSSQVETNTNKRHKKEVFGDRSSISSNNVTDADDFSVDDDDNSVSSFDEFVIDYGGIVLRHGTEEKLDFDSIWMIESKSITKGGPIKFKADKILFRHFSTGKYLGLEQKVDGLDKFSLCLDNEPHEKRSYFMISELHSTSEYLRNAKAVQLHHSYYGVALKRGDFWDNQKAYPLLTTRNKSMAVSMIINRYSQKESVRSSLALGSAEEAMDINFGRAVMYHIAKFVKNIVLPTSATPDVPTIWPRLDPSDLPLFPLIIARVTLFARGYPIRLKFASEEMEKFKASKHIINRRQDMLRQFGLLEALMVIIQKLQPLSDMLNSGASTAQVLKGSFLEFGSEILSDCLSLVYDLIKGNVANQLYIADHLLVILAHVSTDRVAAKVAQELLSDNRELQETKIGSKEIVIFTQKMREVHMNAMYMQLLKTCCSCLGQGLTKNQDLVYHVLFGDYKDVLIDVQLDKSMLTPVDWGIGSTAYELFIEPVKKSPGLLCANLVESGIPSVKLTWRTASQRFAIERVYNQKEIFLSELEIKEGLTSTVTASKSKANSFLHISGDALKVAIHDFFVSQLQLAGEMCLGRNYAIIDSMEKRFSFELLFSILKIGVSEAVRGQAAHLLHYLYIDRDPQSAVPLPRLTRTLNEVNRSNFSDLVQLPEPENAKFALIQAYISTHIDSIRGKPLPLHSLNVLAMLHALVKFHFYGKVPLLQHVVKGLVSILERGDFDLEAEDDFNNFSANVHKLTKSAKMAPMKKGKSQKGMGVIARAPSGISEGDLSSSMHDIKPLPVPRKSLREEATLLLAAMSSLVYHCVMTVVVILVCAATLYFVITDWQGFGIQVFEGVVFLVFAGEWLLRLILWLIVHKEILNFSFDLFNVVDGVSIALYAMIFSASPSFYKYAKFVRLLRCFLLWWMFDSLKATEDSLDKLIDAGATYNLPPRYSRTKDYTLNTMELIINILKTIQQNMLDRQLSLFLKEFEKVRSGKSSKDAKEVLETILDHSSDLAISNESYDDIYMDLIMYSQPTLVQSVLDLIMTHHSSKRLLLDNISALQLITSERDESNFLQLQKVVVTLKRYADTHEIWGKLDTEEHRRYNNETHAFLSELTNQCKKWCEVLTFNEFYEPIKFIQNILRNLGAFDACIKLSKLVLALETDSAFEPVHVNTVSLALAANRLIYWLILDNPPNQHLAYLEFPFFVKSIDSKIESHFVIKAIFQNNLELMEKVPKTFIGEFVEMICNIGKFPQYLALMSSIIHMGDKNVITNQYEVIKLVSAPDNQKKVVHYFVPASHPDYAKKLRLMSSYLNVKDVTINDLPSDLAYHLEFLELLSSCTIGTTGMTSIEAKVQGMYNFVDLVEAMLDTQCLLLAKIRYGLFFYNAMLDVETPLPALKDAAVVWKIFVAAQDVFTFAKDDLRQIEKNGWAAPTSNRQRIEFMLVNVMIIHSYFTAYFDYSIFKPEVGQIAVGVERISFKEAQANEIMKSLFNKIVPLYEMLSPLLAREHHELLYKSLIALNNASKDKFVSEVQNLHNAYFSSAAEYIAADEDKVGKAYGQLIAQLHADEDIQKSMEAQIQEFINKIEGLPLKRSTTKADVCFEPFIEKLVSHIRGSVQIVIHGDETIKVLTPNATKTSVWLLRIFRTMIENRWGMTIYERDDDGGEEQDDAVSDLMVVYNESGMTELCLDLISKGIDITLQSEALKLLVGMLFKEGGALAIQKSINVHLSRPGSDIFFRTVRQILHNMMTWHEWQGVVTLAEGQDPTLPDEIIIVRCLQLFCEGHFKPNQDILREQPQNNTSMNLLDDFVLYLQQLDRFRCRTSTAAGMAVSATILEVIQGPCEHNQDHFALNTELIEILNRKLRQRAENDCDECEELEFKKGAIDILQALLEGQGRKTQIYERMLSVIHVDVILVLCKGRPKKFGEEEEEEPDESVELRTEALVLLQMLTDFRPAIKQELGLGDDLSKDFGSSVACIEVFWRGELQRRFFHVPDLCQLLSQSTKDNFVMNVKRSSPEEKLFGLLEGAKEMYREVLHQRKLQEYRLDGIFSRTNQTYASWFNFYVTVIINILFVVYYVADDINCSNMQLEGIEVGQDLEYYYNPVNVDDESRQLAVDAGVSRSAFHFCTSVTIRSGLVQQAIFALTWVLIGGAAFTLLSNIVVRAPVSLQTYMENGNNIWRSLLFTLLEGSSLRYLIYLAFPIVGLFYHPALSIVMLDFISMSPTTQAVLNAVYDPRKQIAMTITLTLIILYIFAMFDFFFFGEPGTDFAGSTYNYNTLERLFKLLVRYGFPYASPINQMVQTISSYRVFCDLAFFLSCIVMSNVLKGITIDTFVALRSNLEKRIEDTTERCFICGIEKNTFNRTLDRDAFRQHIKDDQNLWNYIYFIMYVWEQDKDDDDGFEWYARRCIDDNDLSWFPMNKAIRLAEFQERGDVRSLKYRFRQVMKQDEQEMEDRMKEFKEQVNRTLIRVEKALELESEVDARRSRKGVRSSILQTAGPSRPSMSMPATPMLAMPMSPATVGNGGGVTGWGSNKMNGVGGRLLPFGAENPRGVLTPKGIIRGFDDVLESGSNMIGPMSQEPDGIVDVGITSTPLILQKKTSFRNTVNIMPSSAPQPPSMPRQPQSPSHIAFAPHAFSALDMEEMSLMHLRLLSITGLMLVPEYIKYVQVKVSSDFETRVLHPIADVETVEELPSDDVIATNSHGVGESPTHYANKTMKHMASSLRHARKSFSIAPTSPVVKRLRSVTTMASLTESLQHQREDGAADISHMDDQISLVKLNFDNLDSSPILAHQGPLPNYDLSKIMINVQVLFNASGDANTPGVYLAGGRIPLILLLNKAMEGGVLELVLYQRSLQLKVKHPSLATQKSKNSLSEEDENSMKMEDVQDDESLVDEMVDDASISPQHVDDAVDYASTVGAFKRMRSLRRSFMLQQQIPGTLDANFSKQAMYAVSAGNAGVIHDQVPDSPTLSEAVSAWSSGNRIEQMSVTDNLQVKIAVSAVASRQLLQDWAQIINK